VALLPRSLTPEGASPEGLSVGALVVVRLVALDGAAQRATVSLRDAPRGAEGASPLRLLASGPVFPAPDEEDALRSASELERAQAEVQRLAGEPAEAHAERDGLRDQAEALGKALRDVREALRAAKRRIADLERAGPRPRFLDSPAAFIAGVRAAYERL
jgi:hypothetical protein